jgi:hypothetical protein
MRLNDVMDEVALAFGEVTGLNSYGWPEASPALPAVVMNYPEGVDYDQTYDRGEDTITDLQAIVLIGNPQDRDTRDKAAQWADGDGPTSIKNFIEGYAYTSCDDVQVIRATFESGPVAGIPCLHIVFSCNVTGSGRD